MKMADDPDVAAMDINVDTTDGIVTLNGGREKKLKMTSVDAMYYD
jgi:osmotically-inducible protein OsmY